jgi:hypothetical protein
MAVEVNILSSDVPGRSLVLESERQRRAKPVLNIVTPEQSSIHLDVDMLQAGGVHHSTDIVGRVLEDDVAISFAVIKGSKNSWSIVAVRLAASFHYASLASATRRRGSMGRRRPGARVASSCSLQDTRTQTGPGGPTASSARLACWGKVGPWLLRRLGPLGLGVELELAGQGQQGVQRQLRHRRDASLATWS